MKHKSVFSECAALGWGIWQCPPFLFLVMGFTTILSMLGSALLVSRYFPDPEAPAIIIASFIAVLFLAVGNAIINGFNKLAEASRIKSQFVSIISHQLRTPISIFKWTLEALQQTVKDPKLSNDTDLYMLNLLDASQRMIRLVNTLLDVTRIEGNNLVLQNEDVSLPPIIKKLIDGFQRYAEASHVSIAIDVDANVPTMHVDRHRISMIMDTFIDNAIRYTVSTGTVTIRLKQEGSFVRFSVSDMGIGIPMLQQKNIFQKFFRATNIMQFQTEGTGIDLFISKYVIEKTGGTIGFNSEEGRGSTFWFMLPIK